MTFKNRIIFFLYRCFGKFNLINILVRFFYVNILTPILFNFLKWRFSNIKDIHLRHSVTEKKSFNAFLSDIDLTIVIENDSSSTNILKYFFQIKKILLMLDYPEVYYVDEYELLKKIQNNPSWNIIYTLWCIRKINWNYKSIASDDSLFNKTKKERSIAISCEKIFKECNFPLEKLELHNFKFLANLDIFDAEISSDKIYFQSQFLETNLPSSIQIYLSPSNCLRLKSLLPGEIDQYHVGELKKFIQLYEILITKASIRLDEAKGIGTSEKKIWLNKLETLDH
jgi:hypothetical protein